MNHTLQSLAAEQQEMELETFNYDFAWNLGAKLRQIAAGRGAPVAITIAHGRDLVFTALMPGATPDNLDWTARKRAVAHRFHRSSLSMRLEAEANGFDFNVRYRLPEADFVASGGGVPLMQRNGTLLGSVGVSGLPDTEDHAMIIEALRVILGRPAS